MLHSSVATLGASLTSEISSNLLESGGSSKGLNGCGAAIGEIGSDGFVSAGSGGLGGNDGNCAAFAVSSTTGRSGFAVELLVWNYLTSASPRWRKRAMEETRQAYSQECCTRQTEINVVAPRKLQSKPMKRF
ncbi:hypothetical protein Bca52824_077168 [Brassica carinata]|uniref:Uncharacterized protein n=1 Tax=Brassica carinata TaxID=52824 RepID=A0A8X7PYG1_BRACI|nr:hypothetical protein Bca52824_077168 [Brassica carinata]